MNDEKPPLSAAIRHLADRQRRALTGHPSAAELTAYHAGELPPEAAARLREHLALCRDCSDLLLDLAGFAELTPPPGVPELTDAEVEQDWQALRVRLGEKPKEEPRPAPVVPIRLPKAPATPQREFSLWKILVAAAMIVAIGLSVRLALTPPPQGGPVVVFDDGGQVRSGGADQLPRMSSSQPGVFIFYSEESYASYQGEIAEEGEVVWKTDFNTVPEAGRVSFMIPAGSLKPGRYEARLIGILDSRREPIGRLSFEVDGP